MKLLALLTLALPLLAHQHGTDPVQLDTGARSYSANCSVCHGPDGDQVSGVELKRGKFRRASTDDELAKIIQTGIPGTAMPPNATRACLIRFPSRTIENAASTAEMSWSKRLEILYARKR